MLLIIADSKHGLWYWGYQGYTSNLNDALGWADEGATEIPLRNLRKNAAKVQNVWNIRTMEDPLPFLQRVALHGTQRRMMGLSER